MRIGGRYIQKNCRARRVNRAEGLRAAYVYEFMATGAGGTTSLGGVVARREDVGTTSAAARNNGQPYTPVDSGPPPRLISAAGGLRVRNTGA